MKNFTFTTLLTALLVSLTACAPLATPVAQPTPAPTQLVVMAQIFDYISVTYPEMVAQADMIWVGRVNNISPMQWNQDSGEMWDGGLQLHYVDIEVLQPIVENLQLEGTVRVTALGVSPLEGHADHDLSVGEQAVVFARATQLAWRGGPKPIIELLGDPSQSYLKQTGNNSYSGALHPQAIELNDLIDEIARIPAENPTPTIAPFSSPTPVPPMPATEIKKLLLNSHARWQTLDLDATTTWFTPDGPQIVTSSVQIEQLANVRVTGIQRGADGQLMFDWLWLSNGAEILSQNNLANTAEVSKFPYAINTLRNWQPPSVNTDGTVYRHPIAMLMQSQLGDYLYPVGLAQLGEFTPVGEDYVAERLAIVVVWERHDANGQLMNKAQYWVDVQTGIVLKTLSYAGKNFTELAEETVITRMRVDEPLAPEIFRLPTP